MPPVDISPCYTWQVTACPGSTTTDCTRPPNDLNSKTPAEERKGLVEFLSGIKFAPISPICKTRLHSSILGPSASDAAHTTANQLFQLQMAVQHRTHLVCCTAPAHHHYWQHQVKCLCHCTPQPPQGHTHQLKVLQTNMTSSHLNGLITTASHSVTLINVNA